MKAHEQHETVRMRRMARTFNIKLQVLLEEKKLWWKANMRG